MLMDVPVKLFDRDVEKIKVGAKVTHPKFGDGVITEVTPNSNKKVWWRCRQGHEWVVAINNRTNGIG